MIWRKRPPRPKIPARPKTPPKDTGGTEARERAEAALVDVRARKAKNEPLRRWFRAELAENHFGQDITRTFAGRKA